MAESKHLGPELGVGAGAYQDEATTRRTSWSVWPRSMHVETRLAAMTIRWPSSEAYPWPPTDVPSRIDANWCTAHLAGAQRRDECVSGVGRQHGLSVVCIPKVGSRSSLKALMPSMRSGCT